MKSGGDKLAVKGAVAVPPESPLVPNSVLKRLYSGMLESRLLEARLRARHRKTPRPHVHGQEACRVSALLDLTPEDFSSDVYGSVSAAYLRGEPLARLWTHRAGARNELPGLLPELVESHERLHEAIGVALTLKRLGTRRVVVFLAAAGEIKPTTWLPSLHRAAELELPMFFVLLPEIAGKSKLKVRTAGSSGLSARATAAGVPGIPVDASDPVALYRVAQESLGRARAGGGPAWMECVPFAIQEKKPRKKVEMLDPLTVLEATLLRRQVCDANWLAGVEANFQDRLDALTHQ